MQIAEDVGAKNADLSARPAAAGERHVNGDDPNGLTEHSLTELLHALQAMRVGDFSARMAGDRVGLIGKIADTFNDIVATNQRMAEQLERVGQVVGREGRTRQRVRLGLSDGAWGEMESSVNSLIDDLLWPTTEVTRAIAAVAQGNLLQTVPLDVDGRPLRGEFLRSAEIVNTMIQQLSVFTSEVTRVAREVGTEGKLGGQAQVGGVTGVWKDLTENVNSMASNLTAQVRNIAEVTIAVASGDLSKKITVDVRGEILQLKEAINTMVDQLRSFASEVTRVAREVGTEGKLGGQAIVPGVAGTWKDLTDSVNAMCGNLTDQVRNIAHVTTAVARGDLSRKITVDVRGEIARHRVDTVGQILPRARHAGYRRLAAELALGADLARDACHLGSEGAHLFDDGVDYGRRAQEFAREGPSVDLQAHGLLQIALGHRRDGACHLRGRPEQVIDERVDGALHRAPGARAPFTRHAMARLSVLADDLTGALELACQLLIGGDDLVEGVGDLAGEAGVITRQAHGEIAVAHGLEGAQQLALIESRLLRCCAAIRGADGALRCLMLHQPVSVSV